VVRALLSRGAAIGTRDRNGESALVWATRGGHDSLVTLLLERGAGRDLLGCWRASRAARSEGIREMIKVCGWVVCIARDWGLHMHIRMGSSVLLPLYQFAATLSSYEMATPTRQAWHVIVPMCAQDGGY
jgi:hypothetical protein